MSMRILKIAGMFFFVGILFCIGVLVYMEWDKRDFIKNLPHSPTATPTGENASTHEDEVSQRLEPEKPSENESAAILSKADGINDWRDDDAHEVQEKKSSEMDPWWEHFQAQDTDADTDADKEEQVSETDETALLSDGVRKLICH